MMEEGAGPAAFRTLIGGGAREAGPAGLGPQPARAAHFRLCDPTSVRRDAEGGPGHRGEQVRTPGRPRRRDRPRGSEIRTGGRQRGRASVTPLRVWFPAAWATHSASGCCRRTTGSTCAWPAGTRTGPRPPAPRCWPPAPPPRSPLCRWTSATRAPCSGPPGSLGAGGPLPRAFGGTASQPRPGWDGTGRDGAGRRRCGRGGRHLVRRRFHPNPG